MEPLKGTSSTTALQFMSRDTTAQVDPPAAPPRKEPEDPKPTGTIVAGPLTEIGNTSTGHAGELTILHSPTPSPEVKPAKATPLASTPMSPVHMPKAEEFVAPPISITGLDGSGGSKEKPEVLKFVLTGGPCAGKTTALARLSTFLRERGFRVYTVPEAATMFFSNGATFHDLATDDKQIEFQANLMATQVHLEDTFERLAAATGSRAVLLCDRGTMDGRAYLQEEVWSRLLERYQLKPVELRDARYNAVFHLVTAADGAVEHYRTVDNVRLEAPEEACALDKRTQKAWLGHPRLKIIDNRTGFETKMQYLVSLVAQEVSLPSGERKFRKFKLKGLPTSFDVDRVEEFFVEKVYISPPVVKEDLEREMTREGSVMSLPDLVAPSPKLKAESSLHSVGEFEEDKRDDIPIVGITTTPEPATSGGGGGGGASVDDDDTHSVASQFRDPSIYPYAFVRRRSQGAFAAYGHTVVFLTPSGEKIERKRIISSREYVAFVENRDLKHRTVRQRRFSFIHEGTFMEIYHYTTSLLGQDAGLTLLNVQVRDRKDKVHIPDWIRIEEEVTGNTNFGAYTLSLRERPGSD